MMYGCSCEAAAVNLKEDVTMQNRSFRWSLALLKYKPLFQIAFILHGSSTSM